VIGVFPPTIGASELEPLTPRIVAPGTRAPHDPNAIGR
jgi:hypothetical protein